MVGAIAKVVEAAFGVREKSAGGSPHPITIGTLGDLRGGGKSGTANRIVLGAGPEAENDEIRFVALPQDGVVNVLMRNPKYGVLLDRQIRRVDLGWRIRGGVHTKQGFVA